LQSKFLDSQDCQAQFKLQLLASNSRVSELESLVDFKSLKVSELEENLKWNAAELESSLSLSSDLKTQLELKNQQFSDLSAFSLASEVKSALTIKNLETDNNHWKDALNTVERQKTHFSKEILKLLSCITNLDFKLRTKVKGDIFLKLSISSLNKEVKNLSNSCLILRDEKSALIAKAENLEQVVQQCKRDMASVESRCQSEMIDKDAANQKLRERVADLSRQLTEKSTAQELQASSSEKIQSDLESKLSAAEIKIATLKSEDCISRELLRQTYAELNYIEAQKLEWEEKACLALDSNLELQSSLSKKMNEIAVLEQNEDSYKREIDLLSSDNKSQSALILSLETCVEKLTPDLLITPDSASNNSVRLEDIFDLQSQLLESQDSETKAREIKQISLWYWLYVIFFL